MTASVNSILNLRVTVRLKSYSTGSGTGRFCFNPLWWVTPLAVWATVLVLQFCPFRFHRYAVCTESEWNIIFILISINPWRVLNRRCKKLGYPAPLFTACPLETVVTSFPSVTARVVITPTVKHCCRLNSLIYSIWDGASFESINNRII